MDEQLITLNQLNIVSVTHASQNASPTIKVEPTIEPHLKEPAQPPCPEPQPNEATQSPPAPENTDSMPETDLVPDAESGTFRIKFAGELKPTDNNSSIIIQGDKCVIF